MIEPNIVEVEEEPVDAQDKVEVQPIALRKECNAFLSLVHPEGKIEDILVHVDNFIFLANFIVLDFEADKEVPIILGRPFFETEKMLINVQKGELSMRVHDYIVTFNVFNVIKSFDKIIECSIVSKIELLFRLELE
ncbi:Transposon Ty3-I Gag-Pol polyprotein [Gossypium australe]|uniref:Transposon Ty3-I Gag-Pol polyprotein n=1 Tax=Gossypium australe TaxID=47621 RepID=A0A5B6V9E2_9ROSI|nr:Transposon Ty3-I Gag-Pol polyprotein [Gossypium australe]